MKYPYLLFSVLLFGILTINAFRSSEKKSFPETEASFQNFIFPFSTDPGFQYNYISFPLKVVAGEAVDMVPRSQWQVQRLGFGVEFSSILFNDSLIDFDQPFFAAKNENQVHVTAFFLSELSLKQYDFQREQGRWALKKIEFFPPTPPEAGGKIFGDFSNDLWRSQILAKGESHLMPPM